jgi:hypothetical protein
MATIRAKTTFPPGPRAPKPADLVPVPGPNEFDAGQEQAMRQGQRLPIWRRRTAMKARVASEACDG